MHSNVTVTGNEHWTQKGDVRLFLWEKYVGTSDGKPGALRAALFAERHPTRVARLALDAFVWTGEGAPTLVERRKKLPQFVATKRRSIDRAFINSIFARDHPDCAEQRVIDAFADAILV